MYPYLCGIVSVWMMNSITLPIIGHWLSAQSEGALRQDT